ncbi:MAG: hypothetical protein WCI84_07250 [Bacteroidota bacterium]
MKKNLFLFLLFMIGCADPDENASKNIRKGDEFFNKGEYDIAEYYYDKIPVENPLYQTVIRRKEEIKKAHEDPMADTRTAKKAKGVYVTNHTFFISNPGPMPVHRITIVNNTDDNLQFVELEFVYLDEEGNEVSRLSTVLTTYVTRNSQKVFEKITPGIMREKFAKANAVLIKPVFY